MLSKLFTAHVISATICAVALSLIVVDLQLTPVAFTIGTIGATLTLAQGLRYPDTFRTKDTFIPVGFIIAACTVFAFISGMFFEPAINLFGSKGERVFVVTVRHTEQIKGDSSTTYKVTYTYEGSQKTTAVTENEYHAAQSGKLTLRRKVGLLGIPYNWRW